MDRRGTHVHEPLTDRPWTWAPTGAVEQQTEAAARAPLDTATALQRARVLGMLAAGIGGAAVGAVVGLLLTRHR